MSACTTAAAAAAARDGEESAETDRVSTQQRERCVGML